MLGNDPLPNEGHVALDGSRSIEEVQRLLCADSRRIPAAGVGCPTHPAPREDGRKGSPTSFFHRYLDPAESLGEILFGLIMVLTFTLGAAVATGYERGLLLAATGCNVAWGIIDAALFTMSSMFERSRRGRLVRAIRRAPDEETALAFIRDEMGSDLEPVSEHADREHLYRSVHALIGHGTPRPIRLTRDDLMAAIAVFVLVVATALPAAAPFFVVDDPRRALRLSNLLLVTLLFVVGYRWARYIEANPWLVGLGLTGVGLLLVAAAIALGG